MTICDSVLAASELKIINIEKECENGKMKLYQLYTTNTNIVIINDMLCCVMCRDVTSVRYELNAKVKLSRFRPIKPKLRHRYGFKHPRHLYHWTFVVSFTFRPFYPWEVTTRYPTPDWPWKQNCCHYFESKGNSLIFDTETSASV
jgi:hypothetical protein